jgi:uncharacterized protein YyaL (SSP411 family)
LHLYQITKDEFYKRVAEETLDYVRREMLDERGGFYSSQDADSEGEEGKFFVWTPEEVIAILGDVEGKEFCAFYDVTADGNFEGKNILNVKNPVGLEKREPPRPPTPAEAATPPQAGGELRQPPLLRKEGSFEQASRLRSEGERLFAEREKRVKPFRDEKVLTAWNGLMLAAFAEAGAVLGREDYLEVAKRNADFLLENLFERTTLAKAEAEQEQEQERITPSAQSGGHPSFVRTGALLRTWKDGRAKLNAYLEDHANFADGLIELYQASGEAKYLMEAKSLADSMVTEFWDEENGGFFFTANDHEELLVRSKDYFDNATPSGNSAAADVLLRLAKLLGEEKYERFAVTVLRLAASQFARYPGGFGRTLSALEFNLGPTKEIVVIGERGSELEREIASTYLPDSLRVFAAEAEDGSLPLLEGRQTIDGKPTAYVCEDFVCKTPVTSVEDLREQLASSLVP